MSDVEQELRTRRDQALRDILELEEQAERGELSPEVEGRLRRGYEQEAAAAIAALERIAALEQAAAGDGSGEQDDPGDADADDSQADPQGDREQDAARKKVRRRLLQPRYALYALGLLAVVAAGLLLPGYVLDRPTGGFVTGNEALQGGAAGAAGAAGGTSGTNGTSPNVPSAANLKDVTNAELEAVVEANPDVLGMRLALADRYTAEGRYDLAVVQYGKVLEKDPGNPAATARLGWLWLKVDDPQRALRLVDQALAKDPALAEALWYKANILFYGLNDPEGAMKVLATLRQRQDVTAEERGRIDQLWQLVSDKAAEKSK